MLSPTLISIVALYPVAAFAAPVAYFQLFPEEMRELPVLPVDDTDEEARCKAIRLGVNEPLMFYGVLLCCTAMWLWLAQPVFHADGFQGKGWVSGAIKSGYVGFSWAGMWLWLWLVLSNPQRLSRAVPGYGARFLKQTVVWVIGAFSEEFWRVLCIAALTASGYSATFAVTASAIAFGVASLGEGFERSILAALEGSIFGLLFVWQRSFFAPFVAHLAVQAVYLWGVGQFSSGKLSKPWMRGIRCPVCNAQLSRLQIKIGSLSTALRAIRKLAFRMDTARQCVGLDCALIRVWPLSQCFCSSMTCRLHWGSCCCGLLFLELAQVDCCSFKECFRLGCNSEAPHSSH